MATLLPDDLGFPWFFWLRLRLLLLSVLAVMRFFFLVPAAFPEDFTFLGPVNFAFRPGSARRSIERFR